MSGFNKLISHGLQMYERYLPSAFDESFSILEKLNKMIEFLGQVSDLTNDMVEYLNEFQEKFDSKLYKSVEDILSKWYEDGRLFDIIDAAYGGMKRDFEQSFHYDEIKVKEYSNPNGIYYVTEIPTKDKKGNPIYLEKGYANDSFNHGLEIPRSYANRNKTSLTINASTFSTSSGAPIGVHIKDGIVHQNQNTGAGWTLGYNKETQELQAFAPEIEGNTLVNTYGITDAWSAFFPVIENFQPTPSSVWESIGNSSTKNPRTVIAQLANKNILVFTFRGREDDHEGYTYPEMQDVLQSFNVKFAYNLDGGGSTSLVKDNVLVNVPIDGNYRNERKVMDFISVIKPTNKAYESFYETVGDLSATVRKLDARHISKYGDRIPGRLTFDDYFYIANDKAMYGYNENGDPKRILGIYENGRIYLGNVDTPFTIQSSANILVTLGNDSESYRVGLVSNSTWTNVSLDTGMSHMSGRPFQYKKINAFEARLRGAVVVGAGTTQDQLLGTLPSEARPSQIMVIPVSIIAGGRESNDVVIYTNGQVVLRYPITAATSSTAVHIECVINRG